MPKASEQHQTVYLKSRAVRARYGRVSQMWITRRLADSASRNLSVSAAAANAFGRSTRSRSGTVIRKPLDFTSPSMMRCNREGRLIRHRSRTP